MRFLAQQPINMGGHIGGSGLGPIGNIAYTFSSTQSLQSITNLVSAVIGAMTVAAGIWLIFQLLVAGINWITSGGDKHKVEESRDRLTNALIGMVIVVAGWAILGLAGKFLGLDIFIMNPGNVINYFPH